MVRLLGWIVLLAAFSAGVLWLTENPGEVEIFWLGYEIRIQIGILIALILITLIILMPIWMSIRWLLGMPSAWRHRHRKHQHKQGMSALTQALTALAVSDLSTAQRQTKRAGDLLGEGPLTALINAQISYRKDDISDTRKHLGAMMEHDETRYIAARAQSAFARQEGNYAAAIAFAKDALREESHSPWAYRALCDLYIREGRWQEAETLIRNARLRRRLSAADANHLLALFYKEQAQQSLKEGHTDMAWRSIQEAHKQDAGFVPATLLYARIAGEKGERRKALNALSKSFKASPHPDLSEALLDLCADEPAKKLTRRAQNLAKANAAHPESQLMQAIVALHLKQWDTARNHIKSALSMTESARPYRLLATIENEQYDNRQSAAEWLARAAEAPPNPQWICQACGHSHKKWQLHCQHCDSFDSLHWDIPREHTERRAASFLLEN